MCIYPYYLFVFKLHSCSIYCILVNQILPWQRPLSEKKNLAFVTYIDQYIEHKNDVEKHIGRSQAGKDVDIHISHQIGYGMPDTYD